MTQRLRSDAVEPWLTQSELADELKCSRRTIQRYDVPFVAVVGNQKRYLLSQARAFFATGESEDRENVVRFPGQRERGAAA